MKSWNENENNMKIKEASYEWNKIKCHISSENCLNLIIYLLQKYNKTAITSKIFNWWQWNQLITTIINSN